MTETTTNGLGEVYLIGAGPGDPELLTLRALRRLRQADVILYDRLVSQAILDFARADAEMIYVGKACRKHFVEQQEINQQLIRQALTGRRVCRLKGGDPFIFGRGGEELEELAAAGIPFEVVPGVTAASGCAAYAGIPLTHRDYAHSVIFAAGHRREEAELDWDQLARPHQTLVLYMGLRNMAWICQQLLARGVKPSLPAAIIEHGTTPQQRVIEGSVASLPALAAKVANGVPALVIVGEVVKLRHQLDWFSAKAGSSALSIATIAPSPTV